MGTSSNSSERAVRDLQEHTLRRYGKIRYSAIRYGIFRDGEVGQEEQNNTK
jgi:hypothetical protein